MKEYKKMVGAHHKFQTALGAMEQAIADKIPFSFGIIYQPSDGFTLLDIESGRYTAPLSICLALIEEKGILTNEDFRKYCI